MPNTLFGQTDDGTWRIQRFEILRQEVESTLQSARLSWRTPDVRQPLQYSLTADGRRRDPADQTFNRVDPLS